MQNHLFMCQKEVYKTVMQNCLCQNNNGNVTVYFKLLMCQSCITQYLKNWHNVNDESCVGITEACPNRCRQICIYLSPQSCTYFTAFATVIIIMLLVFYCKLDQLSSVLYSDLQNLSVTDLVIFWNCVIVM